MLLAQVRRAAAAAAAAGARAAGAACAVDALDSAARRGLRTAAGGRPGAGRDATRPFFAPDPAALHPTAARAMSGGPAGDGGKGARGEVVAKEQDFDTLTDRIPQKPVSAAEATSYSLVIAAALAVAAYAAWLVANELLIEPRESVVMDRALAKIRDDARVQVRLGAPLIGYGSDGRSRSARQKVAHREYIAPGGGLHLLVQFMVRGPSGAGTVTADVIVGTGPVKDWEMHGLIIDCQPTKGGPSRVKVIEAGAERRY